MDVSKLIANLLGGSNSLQLDQSHKAFHAIQKKFNIKYFALKGGLGLACDVKQLIKCGVHFSDKTTISNPSI